jgi:hypothetical protein
MTLKLKEKGEAYEYINLICKPKCKRYEECKDASAFICMIGYTNNTHTKCKCKSFKLDDFARADKNKLFSLMSNLASAGFRESSQIVVDQHIKDYYKSIKEGV